MLKLSRSCAGRVLRSPVILFWEMRSIAGLGLLLVVSACTGNGVGSTTSVDITTTSTRVTATSALPPVVDCPGTGEFQEGGGIADVASEGSDSGTLGGISWEVNDQCETLRFDFETSEGAPATTVPRIRVDHLNSYQVVRVVLGVETTVLTDQLVETRLVDRLYVVRSLSGEMFVDLHLAQPAAVRATAESSPARLSLELRPGIVPFAGRSTVADNIVLTSPVSSTETTSPVQLLGYARTFEANVLTVVTQGGDVVANEITTAADWTETWGEFRQQVDLPTGQVSVFVGEESADDGGLVGLTVDLTVR